MLNHRSIRIALTALGATAALGLAGAAQAHVGVSIGLGIPGVVVGAPAYYPPAPAYYPPAPVYAPAPVYYNAPPVYVRPQPVYYGPSVYVGPRWGGGYRHGYYGHYRR
jgi:hypothetical protein